MRIACCVILLTLSMVAAGQSVPAAIYTDPPADAAHSASMTVLHIPSHGVEINGLLYAPPGGGKHPTLVICHGLPGNEKNLDLAQAVRRAGWNAVTFNSLTCAIRLMQSGCAWTRIGSRLRATAWADG
jgi:predicted alpha/beta-fold hydrolase